MKVPEVWRYDGSFTILVRRNDAYEVADRSPRFGQLSPQELTGFIASGIRSDETQLTKQFRRRVREALG